VDDRDAESAVREHHGQVFPGATNGRRMRVEISRPRERREYDDRDRDGGRDGGRPRYEERGGDRGFERRDDRGFGGDRDRDRGYERRDDRFGGGDRDRGFGRDRFGGDRERRDFGRRDDRGPRTQQRSEHRLLLLDLPDRTSWQDLKDFVRQSARSGRVLFTEVRADPAKAGFKIGIAEFGSREDLEDAVATLNGKNVHGMY
jgi:RNA recognition motif-containing protein